MLRYSPLCLLTVSVLTVVACSTEPNPLPVGPPSFDVLAASGISGSVTAAGGASICNTFGDGSLMLVRLISLDRGNQVGSQNIVCPTNTYGFPSVAPGNYLLRVQIGVVEALDNEFPWRSSQVLEVGEGAVVSDVVIARGTELGGGVFVDGAPIQGIPLTLFYANTIFGVTSATTGADGRWAEFLGRDNTLLQPGVRMTAALVCDLVGTRLLSQPPFDPFVFGDETSSLTCDHTKAAAAAFSHNRTRLVVTPGAGDIGAAQAALPEELGNGWGVQFPVNPGEQPRFGNISVSQLFMGGLIIGIRPDRILSGLELNGYILPCNCRAFGPEGKLRYVASPKFGKKVTWQYSDAGFSQGVGLKVVQKSYDGVPPADYVLFRFTLSNSGAAPVTIYPGMFADWDIQDDFLDDVGATEGRLMYMTNADGGVAAGSLIISDVPVAGSSFGTLNPGDVRTPEGTLAELAGDVTNPSAPEPADHNYVQSVGPITLAAGGSTQFWIAIVAGESLDQLRSNAAAAAADVAQRGGQPDAADEIGSAGISLPASESGARSQTRRRVSPTCKRGCGALE